MYWVLVPSGLAWAETLYRYPCFSKVHIMPLGFYKRPTRVFAKWKKFKDFHFIGKGEKQKKCSVAVIILSIYRNRMHPKQREGHYQASSPGTILSISASNCKSFELCSGHLCFLLTYFCVSFSKICPKVTEKSETLLFGSGNSLKSFHIN